MDTEKRARRYNKGKRRYNLMPESPIGDIVDVFTKGAHKYSLYRDSNGEIIKGSEIPLEESYKYELVDDGADNWRKGMSWSETMASVKRHIAAWDKRENIDSDLGTKHLANAAWGLIALMEFENTHPELDDRPMPFLNKKRIGLDIDGVLADFTGHLMEVNGTPDHIPKHWNDPIVRKAFDEYKTNEKFWLDLPTLVKGNSLPFEPHCYITARSIGKEVTMKWLSDNGFPVAPVYSIGTGESKVKIARESGIELFVDDSYDNFVQLNKAGIFTYLYTAPYNERYDVGDMRINSLDQICRR